MSDLLIILKWAYSDDYMRYLTVLVGLNFILAVLNSLFTGDFRLVKAGDWITKRMLPLMVGFGAAMLLAWSNPSLMFIRDAAFVTLTATMLGYILSSLRDLGIPIPDQIAGKDK